MPLAGGQRWPAIKFLVDKNIFRLGGEKKEAFLLAFLDNVLAAGPARNGEAKDLFGQSVFGVGNLFCYLGDSYRRLSRPYSIFLEEMWKSFLRPVARSELLDWATHLLLELGIIVA